MVIQKIQITQEKKRELEQELIQLKEVKRPAISDRVATARAHGDLSENAEYHSARNEQAKNEGRIQEIEDILKRAVIIERSGSGKAELGATVVIQKSGDSDTKTYVLVSPQEADMASGKLSITSPLGAGLVGKNTGDSISVETPRGKMEYKIMKIS